MKKIRLILIMTLGIIIGGVIGIKASTLIQSNQVIYKENQTVDVILDELFTELNAGKEKLSEAITNKGITTTSDNTLEEMANNVNNISSGGELYRVVVTYNISSYNIKVYYNGIEEENLVEETDSSTVPIVLENFEITNWKSWWSNNATWLNHTVDITYKGKENNCSFSIGTYTVGQKTFTSARNIFVNSNNECIII